MTSITASRWMPLITLPDLERIPGVVSARDGETPGVVTLTVLSGCEGIARILNNSGALRLGLEVREEVAVHDAPEVVAYERAERTPDEKAAYETVGDTDVVSTTKRYEMWAEAAKRCRRDHQ